MNGLAMRFFWVFAVLMLCDAATAAADSAQLNPRSFDTVAHFSVDKTRMSLSTAIATIEPRGGAPGYSWLRITFYSIRPNVADIAGIKKGDLTSMDGRQHGSDAVLQLSVDKANKVWQVDLSVPGHGCTIASTKEELKRFLQSYRFDGKTLTLKSKGSYTCDMAFMKIPNQTFGWDINVVTPVFRSHS